MSQTPIPCRHFIRDSDRDKLYSPAALGGVFQRLDLVTREEFDVQREVLARARARLAELEQRLAELEQKHSR